MSEVVICEPVRTPIGRYGGAFKGLSAADLGSVVLKGLLARTGLDPIHVEEVIFGNCYPTMDAPALGRVVALDAGLPVHVAGMQIDRRCGSGLQAVIQAVMQVSSGHQELVIAGGAESMSSASLYSTSLRWGGAGGSQLHDSLARGRVSAGGKNHPVPGGMLETAENLRREFGIGREEQDELAYESHRRAAAAAEGGIFAEEIIEVPLGPDKVVTRDEHIRADISMEALGRLRPITKDDPEATVTAGNASGQNDAAAACIVTTRKTSDQLGLRPLARLVSWATAGVEPARMGIGPVPATERALGKAGLQLSDVDVIELNEAFASQVLACFRAMKLGREDLSRVNMLGSGISLGHPVGATGTRILTTMTRQMERQGAKYGLETMCIGGGQGLAAVFERVG